ncbi:MAG: tRNA uridine-5-carboxymethylaminomethyl(34) synthesis GTPase MnmE [Spirochaetia bacterium]|nr:tRNA uridine-5-carboxymethylaminomethyl(34) synthesis GTPase MnmE [Spirochaetia bacterium]
MRSGYDTEELIAALATPWGESALAVIRTSGTGSIEKVASVFKGNKDITKLPGYSLTFGMLRDGEKAVDQVVLGIYRAPKSYTGEDMVEIFCHGSLPGIQAVMELLHKAGFRDSQPGEFTMRSFLNGKVDLTKAEAVNELILSKSRQAQVLALDRLSGSIFDAIDQAKHFLADILAAVEIQLDYAEDEADPAAGFDMEKLDKAADILSRLAATYQVGKLYKEGIRIALAGRTNAGKSKLFNLFLKEDRSIVSDIKGTTRDYIESSVAVKGIPAVLIDTAGFRSSDDPVEAEGIRRSNMVIENADIILYLVDGSEGLTPEDEAFIKEHPCIPLWNKIDKTDAAAPEGFVPISAATGAGFDGLEELIYTKAMGSRRLDTGEAVIDSQRQKDLIDRSLDAIGKVKIGMAAQMPLDVVAVDLEEAVNALGELTGEITSSDILENMFSRFCVGK